MVGVCNPLILVARTYPEEGARGLLLQRREILPSQVGAYHLEGLLPEDLSHRLFYRTGDLFIVDHGPVAELVLEFVSGTVGFRDPLDDTLHELWHPLPDFGIQGANRPEHLHATRDDVVRRTAGELRDRDDHVVYGVDTTGDDVLEVGHNLRPYRDLAELQRSPEVGSDHQINPVHDPHVNHLLGTSRVQLLGVLE